MFPYKLRALSFKLWNYLTLYYYRNFDKMLETLNAVNGKRRVKNGEILTALPTPVLPVHQYFLYCIIECFL